MDLQRKLFEQQGADSRGTYENGVAQMAVLGALATLLGAVLAWWITRSITTPLGQAVRVAETVAAGHLDGDISAQGRDETAQLMRALRAMNDSLAKVVGEVRAGTELIATAKEIKLLIDDSVQQTGIGSRLVEQAGATMQEVVGSVARVSGIVAEISAASQEQADGIEQVNQAIVNMDDVTQQNAALVEQSAAAAGSLQEQAANLVRVVGVFKTAGAAVRMASAPAPRARVLAPAKRAPAPAPLRLAAAGADWVEF